MAHTPSQNVLFVGESPGDEEYDPPGAFIARQVAEGLRSNGFSPSPIDNWRDCGWSMDLEFGDAELQIALTATAEPKGWMLQIACMNDPGFIGRLLGKRFVDRSSEIFETALAVHDSLVSSGFTHIRWCLDGYPDDAESTPQPVRPNHQVR